MFIDDMGIGGQAKPLLYQGMKNKPNTNTHKVNSTQTAKAKRIKLGIDVHADSYRVVCQMDEATLQPAQEVFARSPCALG